MNELWSFVNQPFPIGVVIVASIVITNYRVNDLKKDVSKLFKKLDDRFEWCLDHFNSKDSKGGE